MGVENASSIHGEPPGSEAVRHRFVFLSATGYDSPVSGRTRRLADVLAAQGHDVVYVELPSVRNVVRPFLRFGPRAVPDSSIRVVRLCPLPGYVRFCRSMVAARWAARAARRLAGWIPDLDRSIVVTSTPRWSPVVRSLPHALRCYDYIDHVRVQAGPTRTRIFEAWDEALLAMSDMVTTVSEPLRKHLARRVDPDRIFMVPNGVPDGWAGAAVQAVPRTVLAGTPDRIIAGFLGSLFEWIDVELLVQAARALPQVEFVLVGPSRRGVRLDALRAMSNVRCVPAVPFSEVPKVIKAFDVCLIPFRRDIVAECADPLKVYEYCALGKPVVSTVAFGVHGEHAPIAVAGNAADFADAIERAAADDCPERRAERKAFARRHTWERRAKDLVAAVGKVLHSV